MIISKIAKANRSFLCFILWAALTPTMALQALVKPTMIAPGTVSYTHLRAHET